MKQLTLTAALLALAGAACAQSSVTVYGSIDQYLNAMRSSSGTRLTSLEDGAFLRSRWGIRGTEDLGGGLQARFNLEAGLSTDTGAPADATRGFDRQSWVGLAGGFGEIRFGRQNGPIFARGGNVDYTTRTLGSMINNFGVPSRFDNDFGYISPRIQGLQVEAHVALPEAPNGSNRALVYQAALDYVAASHKLGYMGLRGRAATGATVDKDVVYDNVYANWMHGKGTVYLAWVRSNNNTATAVGNNAGTILGNVGGFNAGTNADLRNFYEIWQVSADYQVTDQLRVGGLWGTISDKSGRGRGASGGSLGAYYALSKRTTLLALVETLRNDADGGWRPAGSAGLKTNFTAPSDINGRTISGVQLGVVHRF